MLLKRLVYWKGLYFLIRLIRLIFMMENTSLSLTICDCLIWKRLNGLLVMEEWDGRKVGKRRASYNYCDVRTFQIHYALNTWLILSSKLHITPITFLILFIVTLLLYIECVIYYTYIKVVGECAIRRERTRLFASGKLAYFQRQRASATTISLSHSLLNMFTIRVGKILSKKKKDGQWKRHADDDGESNLLCHVFGTHHSPFNNLVIWRIQNSIRNALYWLCENSNIFATLSIYIIYLFLSLIDRVTSHARHLSAIVVIARVPRTFLAICNRINQWRKSRILSYLCSLYTQYLSKEQAEGAFECCRIEDGIRIADHQNERAAIQLLMITW